MLKRGRKKKNSIESKIAQIGDYVSPKKEEEKEEVEEEAPPIAEEVPEEKPEELTPEQLKEKITKLISEISSRGLNEEEKVKFIDDFKFWNDIAFDILDIGNNLKTLVGRTSLTLSPGKALLIYLGLTAGLVILLRSDLQSKLFKREKRGGAKEVVKEEKPVEEGLKEVPKQAPKPKI